jgi:hypothetical protein
VSYRTPPAPDEAPPPERPRPVGLFVGSAIVISLGFLFSLYLGCIACFVVALIMTFRR